MRRRHAIQSLLGLPVLTALPAFAQQSATDTTKPQPQEKLPPELKPAPVEEFPKLALTSPDSGASGVAEYFSPAEFASLGRLCSLMVPAVAGKPGAIDAGVPAFLDFLIGKSPSDRQHLYRAGLDTLEKGAQKRYGKTFAGLNDSEAATQLEPFHGFLEAAKDDILRATLNSREWAAASTQRRGSGIGTYWRTIE